MSTPIPTVNVNLAPCDCSWTGETRPHDATCRSAPVRVPMPLDAFRSVALMVRLGECSGRCTGMLWQSPPIHGAACPARPIRVSCSIFGKTWEESEVADVEKQGPINAYQLPTELERTLALAASRGRWALVKALVTGGRDFGHGPNIMTDREVALVTQRDAVFSALAKAHRAEDSLIDALEDYEEAMRGEPVGIHGLKRESHGALERYVGHLVDQVGAMP